MGTTKERKELEREFFDEVYASEGRHPRTKYYEVTEEGSSRHYRELLFARCADKDVLDYGCGNEPFGIELARRGARVRGFDLSPVAVEQANARARAAGIDGEPFEVMDGEALRYPDDSFDVVCGYSILHHLVLGDAFSEVVRVLRPDGLAVFVEPLGHNPLINAYRWWGDRTAGLHTRDEHPLRAPDLELPREYFERVEHHFYHLFSLASVVLRRTRAFAPVTRALVGAERGLFGALPPARRLAWQVLLVMERPRKESARR